MLDAAPAGRDVTLNVASGGEVAVMLIRTAAGAPETVCAALSQFAGDQGTAIAPQLTVPDEADAKGACAPYQGLKPAAVLTPMRIKVPVLPAAGRYSGNLIMYADGFDPIIWRIALVGATAFRPAVLVVDRDDILTSVTTFPLGHRSASAAQSYIQLSDKARQWPLQDVTLRQLSDGRPSDLDALRDFAYTWNGQAWPHPGDLNDKRQVTAPAEPATVGIAPGGLAPGEYNVYLQFQAVNAGDDGGKLHLRILVRHAWPLPVAVLALALVLSFILTKLIVSFRHRLVFLRRVNDLKGAWIARLDPIFPVVWYRAMLKETETLSRRFWLTGQDYIDDRLRQVALLSGLLHRAQEIDAAFEQFPPSEVFVKRRAESALRGVLSNLDVGTLDEQSAARARADLETMTGWVLRTDPCYWDSLVSSTKELLAVVAVEAFPVEAQDDVKPLLAALTANLQTPPPDRPTMRKFEEKGARLKILWERRRFGSDFDALLAMHRCDCTLDDLFAESDRRAWERLKKSNPQIVLPQGSDGDPLESFEPLAFQIETPADAEVADTYLVRHGLIYNWTFTLTNRRRNQPPIVFAGTSNEPQVVAFAPERGTLTASVSISYNNDTIAVKMRGNGEAGVSIVESHEFGIDRSFERIEVVSFAIAFLAAFVSGLSLMYAKNPTFGTFSDYVGLFLWGVGIDQGKNLVQTLQITGKS